MKKRFESYPLSNTERPRRQHVYYVTGTGTFPYDMLRYDSCWPMTGVDAAKIDWYENNARGRENRSIRMLSFREPTIDRWSSFGWLVGTENLEREVSDAVAD